MSDYNQYVTAINTIFNDIEKMKAGWNYLDNLNYIQSVEEYKKVVSDCAEKFKEQAPAKSVEVLGNDR